MSEPANLGTEERPLRVAVIGSGPSGFYAAAALLKADPVVEVDVFDRLPTPFGLVRGGVAPDHQKIKNVIRVYNKTAALEGFRFLGNVKIGRDLSVEDLLEHYDQVVFAVGNESDRAMSLPGEDLDGVHSATEFVGWYNGHPDFQDRHFALDQAQRVAVVGNGNVAMDVARVLTQDLEVLAATDITDEALDALRASTVEEVLILGRRGPAQAAFSPKEIKELGELAGADLVLDPAETRLDEISQKWVEGAPVSTKKNVEFLTAQSAAGEGEKGRKIRCRFLVSPVEFLGEDGKLQAVKIERNELYAAEDGTPRPRGTGQHETLPVDLVFKAVGYRGVPLVGVPFHDKWGTFPNDEGRLTEFHEGPVVPRQYVVGWAKRGPSGLIGTNGPDSQATVAKMLEDLPSLDVDKAATKPSTQAIDALLAERGVDVVTFEDWERLDADEIARGEAIGKVRQKYSSVEDMLQAIRRLRESA